MPNITEILNSICNLVIDFLSRMNDESTRIVNRYGGYENLNSDLKQEQELQLETDTGI